MELHYSLKNPENLVLCRKRIFIILKKSDNVPVDYFW